jgi:hypothetical protein
MSHTVGDVVSLSIIRAPDRLYLVAHWVVELDPWAE